MSILASFIVPHPPLIIPNIGKGSEKQVSKTISAYKEIAKQIATLNPETIIISSPHAPMYSDYFYISSSKTLTGNLANFGATEISFTEEVDTKLVDEISSLAQKYHFPTSKEIPSVPLDHGTMIPLYFIREELPKCLIIVIGLSTLPLITNYQMGTIIKEAVNNLNRNVVYIASGDLSHKLQEYGPYGFATEGPIYDKKIMDICRTSNFYELLTFKSSFLEKAAECGHRSFTIMAGCFDGQEIESQELSHEDITGVGYGICSFYPKKTNPSRQFLKKYLKEESLRLEKIRKKSDSYVNLAYQSLEYYFKYNSKMSVPDNIPSEMLTNKSGVFVSLYKYDTLRGCIGTISPTTKCIAEEIINNALSAAFNDYRFSPLTEEELKWLEITVYILKEPEDIPSKYLLDVHKYGVIVYNDTKRGLLLPDLDGIDTIDQQISIALQKAHINPKEDYKLQRFEVIKHY